MPVGTFLRNIVGWMLRSLPSRLRMRSDWDRRARQNAQHFIACGHSETDDAFWASGRQDLDQLILHDVNLEPGARALEIGCGVGRLLRPLSERVDKAFGVDISAEMIERARKALADRGNIEVFVTSGWLDPFADASLDFVYSFIVFQHIPTKKAVARYIGEAARVLKGQGVFRFQVDGRPRSKASAADTWVGVWYEPEELRRELDARGFTIVDQWGEGTHYLWVTALREDPADRTGRAAVRLRRRAWRRDALEGLLARMDLDPAAEAEAVVSGRRSLRRLADRFIEKHGDRTPEAFVRRAYEVFLGREADEGGLAFYSREIVGGVHRSNTIDCLLSSSELEDRLRPHEMSGGPDNPSSPGPPEAG
jgi:SAM-dependent methyltransferase